jgi:type VI secretion system secreted protein VgrG
MDAPMTPSKGPITLDPPAEGQSLIFRAMTANEELGRLFRYDLELLSQEPNLKATDLLGQPMTVHLEVRGGDIRHFNGYVTEFSLAGSAGNYALYHLTLRPWLWFLSRTANCRIFQGKSIPDILKLIFRDHGMTDFEEALAGTYAARDFVVQYRETDFNFVSRLMEQEGIYYFFKHDDGKHTMVLADSYSAHDPAPGCDSLPYFPPDEHRDDAIDYVDRWETSHQVQTGAYALTDFDFHRPHASLLTKLSVPNEHPKADFEVFDYPGDYALTNNGQDYVRIRLEEINTDFARADGETNARGLLVGSLLTLTEHPVEEQNREYLVVSGRHRMRTHDPESGHELPDEEVYRCAFRVIESSRPYRPARITRKPVVHGPQTAIVVGKSGEEIWTDDFGRVKVKFHWDRFAKGDETSSCWIRVAQVWAGGGWGGIHIPRIGQEVIIEFLEGDPDCPIITGRVYNADNMPPYALPGNQTQSGLKSHSTKGGSASNFNELKFEDKKGSEQVHFQAEKDLETLVKNNESHTVGAARTISVGATENHTVTSDRTKTVNANETTTIAINRTETVGADETITIGVNRTETVGAAESITIGATRTTTIAAMDTLAVGGAQNIAVGGLRDVNVGGAESIIVGAARSVVVGAVHSTTVGGNRTSAIGGNETVQVAGNRANKVGGDDALSAGKKIGIGAGQEIVISSGSATVTLKKSGEILIKGKDITVEGSGKITIKAGPEVIIKGGKVGIN